MLLSQYQTKAKEARANRTRLVWGDNPCFLASLGTLSLIGLAKRATEGLREGFPQKVSHRSSWGIPPDPRFLASLGALSLIGVAKRATGFPQKTSHRSSWGILPQTPVFSLRSARCH
jgi:hypothetical protein